MEKKVEEKKPANYERTKAYRELKADMLDDLSARGLVSKQYTDKVDEYMALWITLQELHADIRERGVMIEYKNGMNQFGTTENKSITSAVRVSAQMLSIFAALGFKDGAVNAKPGDGDGDEL